MTDEAKEFDAVTDVADRFSALNLDELRLLEVHLQAVISDRLLETGFELEQQLSRLHEIAASKGIKLKASTKKVYPPRFRNPEPPHQEWSGRGRRPNWIRHYDQQFQDEAKTDAHCAVPLPGLTAAE